MKKAFIIGHNARDGGFYSPFLQSNEFDFFSQMESDLKTIGQVFYHDPFTASYRQRMQETTLRINRYEYDLVMALHFNAFENPQAHGAEALYYGNDYFGRFMTERFCRAVNELMGIRNRGAKSLRNSSQRGYWEVKNPKVSTILLEPFFGSNERDCGLFDKDTFIHVLKNL